MFYHQWKQTESDEIGGRRGPWPLQPAVTDLQGILTHCLVGLSLVVQAGIEREIDPSRTGIFTAKALVTTHGPSAADPHRLIELIQQAVVLRDQLKEQILTVDPRAVFPPGPTDFEPATTFEGLLNQARQIRPERFPSINDHVLSLKRILLTGIRSIAAYADHVRLLGYQDDQVSTCLFDNLSALHGNTVDADELIRRIRDCGRAAQSAMALLDGACVRAYGEPSPSAVPLGIRRGGAILVSGRNFGDLKGVLRQTEGTGIRVYTHGELLDAHQYPDLKRYPQLAGHYQETTEGLEEGGRFFPGPVVLTAGSPVPGEPGTGRALFSSGELSRPGITHIVHQNFRPVIRQALAMAGFTREEDCGQAWVGNSPESIAEALGRLSRRIKAGAGRRILLAAGCRIGGGPQPSQSRQDGMVSLSCSAGAEDQHVEGKRSAPVVLGRSSDPRIIVRVVEALAGTLKTTVGALPLTVTLAWPGQKTVGVMLALTSLGARDIRLGPTLSTGVTPDLFETLEERLGIWCESIPPVCHP